jgi:hypothetical protein
VTVSTNKTKRPLFTRKASHGTYVPATLCRDSQQCWWIQNPKSKSKSHCVVTGRLGTNLNT